MSPRTGRPTDNPRPHKISIRINDESKKILESYCEQENVTKTEAIEQWNRKIKGRHKKITVTPHRRK